MVSSVKRQRFMSINFSHKYTVCKKEIEKNNHQAQALLYRWRTRTAFLRLGSGG